MLIQVSHSRCIANLIMICCSSSFSSHLERLRSLRALPLFYSIHLISTTSLLIFNSCLARSSLLIQSTMMLDIIVILKNSLIERLVVPIGFRRATTILERDVGLAHDHLPSFGVLADDV